MSVLDVDFINRFSSIEQRKTNSKIPQMPKKKRRKRFVSLKTEASYMIIAYEND